MGRFTRWLWLRLILPPRWQTGRRKPKTISTKLEFMFPAASVDSTSSSANTGSSCRAVRARFHRSLFRPRSSISASGHISIRYGARGPELRDGYSVLGFAHAIGDSFKIIERGAAEMMICRRHRKRRSRPWALADSLLMKALSTRNDDPSHASRPFDAQQDGFVCW